MTGQIGATVERNDLKRVNRECLLAPADQGRQIEPIVVCSTGGLLQKLQRPPNFSLRAACKAGVLKKTLDHVGAWAANCAERVGPLHSRFLRSLYGARSTSKA
jgi:hypothetical protein